MNLQESLPQSVVYSIELSKPPLFKPQDHPAIPPLLELGCPNSLNNLEKLFKDDGSSTQEESPSPKFAKPHRKGSLIEEAIRVRSRLNSIETDR